MPQFGRAERQAFIRERLAAMPELSAAQAWRAVYQFLAWLDDHSGLLHIYDSHKVRSRSSLWFTRSRIATELLCQELRLDYARLREEIDLLFKEFLKTAERLQPLPPAPEFEVQLMRQLFNPPRTPDELERFANLAGVLASVLRDHSTDTAVASELAYAAASYVGGQGARQNMLGEGFEDVLGLLIQSFSPPQDGALFVGQPLESVDGFHSRPPAWPKGRHIPRPDIAVSNTRRRSTFIVTLKWSLRHDRAGTFAEEADAYDAFIREGWTYRFSALTNDFDLGRLDRMAQFNRRSGQPLFERLYHVCPEILLLVHRATPASRGGSLRAIEEHFANGRLSDLKTLFDEIARHNSPAAP